MSKASNLPARFSKWVAGKKDQVAKASSRLAAQARNQLQNFKKPGGFKETIKTAIRNFDPQAALEWTSRTLQKRGTAFYGTMATIALSTYFIADLTALLVEDSIPEPPVARSSRSLAPKGKVIENYSGVFSRNLFNSLGLIPGEDAGTPGAPTDLSGPPVKTSLPFTLIGTLLLSDERKSVATIEDKSASMVYPVQIDDEIPAKAVILKIEPRRVIFLNKIAGRKEFVELPLEPNSQNPRITLGTGGGAGIEKVAPTQYNVSRTEVDKAMGDFNNILTQARAIPNFENGVPAGYKLFQIVPGSIFEKLGLQNGDVITGLNGSAINDPGKAFEMLNDLKTAHHLELQVKKDGKAQTYSYDIH